jgi:hypothetical protein
VSARWGAEESAETRGEELFLPGIGELLLDELSLDVPHLLPRMEKQRCAFPKTHAESRAIALFDV